MSLLASAPDSSTEHDAAMREIEQRVLWLATAIVDHANRVRPNPSGMKVGGHQASSASMVTIMTALWLEQLRADDRVSVKPHASPVLHALEYLLGQLLEELFTRDGGPALRDRIDAMSNPEYQRLLRRTPAELRDLLPGEGDDAVDIARLIADVPDDDLVAAVRNLGGHDLDALRE